MTARTDQSNKTAVRPMSMERLRETWQRQLAADPAIGASALKVAMSISWHLNKERRGTAWPGVLKLAALTSLHRRTVIRAVHWLEESGHLRVIRTRVGKRNLANRYQPVLQKTAAHDVAPVSPPSDRAVSLPSDRAVSPEPTTEPTTEPTILIRISEAAGAASKSELKNSSKGKRHSGKDSPLNPEARPNPECSDSPKNGSAISHPPDFSKIQLSSECLAKTNSARCYRLARDKYGEHGPPLITKAKQDRVDEDEILEAVRESEDVADLGYRLWRP